MPRLIDIEDETVITLDACKDALSARNFDPEDEDSLAHGALLLRRLNNNRDFLGDIILGELARHHREVQEDNAYGPQVIYLGRPDHANCFMRANIWPSRQDHMMRASGGDSFLYGLPHDHNFHFLTSGYFGPGYWSDYYEIDYADITGWRGEPVALRPMGRKRLEPGQVMLYRAHVDVHAQLPADALSVSLNILHTGGAQSWLDQYRIDTRHGAGGRGEVRAILNHGASEAFLRIAVGLGGAEARDLAHRFGHGHPSDRMRLHAWEALASVAEGAAARDALWREAEGAGSRLVTMEARARRAGIAALETVSA